MKKYIKKMSVGLMALSLLGVTSCINEDYDLDNLPGVGEIADLTPPSASYSFSISPEDFLIYQFVNESESATKYQWTLPAGASLLLDENPDATLQDRDIRVRFDALGLYEISLIAMDDLDQSSEIFTTEIDVIEVAGDPIIANDTFTILSNPNSSTGSGCACTGWINRALGTQAEGSSNQAVENGETSDAIKFDNIEADMAYQEFKVAPNTFYQVSYSFKISGDATGTSSLELRVLSGAGFVDGYEPDFSIDLITEAIDTRALGYQSIAEMENPDNNLAIRVEATDGNNAYKSAALTFNSGDNESVALFMRGIGGDGATFGDSGSAEYGWNNGDQEVRVDFVKITVDN